MPNMSKADFVAILKRVAAAYGREPTAEQIAVYYDLLADLPQDALAIAADQACLQHRYATLPPAGLLRELALEVLCPIAMSPLEAWGHVSHAVRRHGWYNAAAALDSLPPLVAAAARMMGWTAICQSDLPDATRAQFLKCWDAVVDRVRKHTLNPPALRARIEEVREKQKRLDVSPDAESLAENMRIPGSKRISENVQI